MTAGWQIDAAEFKPESLMERSDPRPITRQPPAEQEQPEAKDPEVGTRRSETKGPNKNESGEGRIPEPRPLDERPFAKVFVDLAADDPQQTNV